MKELIYSRIYNSYFKQYNRNKTLFRLSVAAANSFFQKGFTAYLAKASLKMKKSSGEGQKIIASLTTFPARIEKVWIAITTIFMQSTPPDAVELWLAKEQFPNGIKDLPDSLLRLQEYGLEICFCEDLRSHKKYYGSMQKHPEDMIVIFDDDMFYPLDTIEKLLELHVRAPQDVVGMSTSIFRKSDLMNPLGWQMQNGTALHKSTVAICGGSCTLFPPHALHPYAFDKEAIKKIAPFADDLWLTAMIYMNGRRISTIGRLPFPILVQNTQEEALTTNNNSAKSEINNNTQWKAILEYYHKELQDWMRQVEQDGE